MNRCVIFGAAPVEDAAFLRTFLRPDDLVLAADGGLDTLRRVGRLPDVWIGDGDSLTEPLPGGLPTVRLPVDKDLTDTQACLDYGLAQGCRDFWLLGGLGGARMDHFLANVALLEYIDARGGTLTLLDARQEIRLVRDGAVTFPPPHRFSVLSVFALDETACVTETGVRFPLEAETLRRDTPLGVSNRPLPEQTAVISVTGRALVITIKEQIFVPDGLNNIKK